MHSRARVGEAAPTRRVNSFTTAPIAQTPAERDFQGHPEYDERALLREYRQDIGRSLKRERETYPALPRGYFDDTALDVLASFREQALLERHEGLIERFPAALLEARLGPMDRSPVTRLYRNWLSYLSAQRTE